MFLVVCTEYTRRLALSVTSKAWDNGLCYAVPSLAAASLRLNHLFLFLLLPSADRRLSFIPFLSNLSLQSHSFSAFFRSSSAGILTFSLSYIVG